MSETTLVKILRWMTYAAAFMPLIIFSQYISPFHFGKVIVFRSWVEIMLVLYLMLIWSNRAYLPKRNAVFWSFLAFTGAFTLTTITSVQPYQSFWGTLERMGGLWSFWHYFIFYCIATSILRTKEQWHKMLELTILAGVLSAFYGFGQKTNISFFIGSGGRERIFGTIGNAALFAGYEIFTLFISIMLYLDREIHEGKWKYVFAGAVSLLAILMTAVRGSLLAVVVGFALLTILLGWIAKIKKARQAFMGIAVAVILFVFFALLFKNTSLVQNSRYLKRVTDFSSHTYTVQTRLWAWQAGLRGWHDNARTIMLGWGPEDFNLPFSKYFNPKFFAGIGSETLFDRGHNMFVEVTVTMGLVGLFTYVSIFIVLIRLGWRLSHNDKLRSYGIVLIPMTIAYMIHNSFIFDTSANLLAFFTVMSFASFLLEYSQSEPVLAPRAEPLIKSSPLIRNLFISGVAVATVVLIYKTNILPVEANYATTRAIIAGWNSDFTGAMSKYKEAVSYDVPGKYDFRNRMAQYLIEQGTNKSELTPDMVDAIQFAIQEVNKNAADYPHDYLPLLYLSRLNILLGRNDPVSPYNDEALKYAFRALDISPTFVRTYFEIAQAYLNKKDKDKAVEYFKKAAELNPDAGISFWYWGSVEIERGNVKLGLDLARQALQHGYAPTTDDYLRLARVYADMKDYQSVVLIYEKLVQMVPADPQYHASLAVAYAQIGDIDKAVAEAHKAAEIDPSFTKEAQAFVQALHRQW